MAADDELGSYIGERMADPVFTAAFRDAEDRHRYSVEKIEMRTECTHPLCDRLHQRFHDSDGLHPVFYWDWIVWDLKKDDYATDDHFDTKREANAWVTQHLGERDEHD